MNVKNIDRKYYESKREDLIKFIPPDARHILDVGCGIGSLGQTLKSVKGRTVEVIGIECVSEIGEIASKTLDKVFIGDAEKINLPLSEGYFDCIIYGDVLEHLLDPWELLKKHRPMLKKGGYVIASIPNIAHYRIIKMLKKKEWNYGDSGILDKTHLRFFTIKSIERMFKDADLKVVKIENKIGGSNLKKFLNKMLSNLLLDQITEQYVIVAKK